MSEELTPTARTILGFLASHPRSGYEIREAAKRAVSFFWGVSDGQLYPQLKQLAERNLIEAVDQPDGPRARQTWRLTKPGRAAFLAWLREPSAPLQTRDENLVKILFASQLDRGETVRLVQERRASFQWLADHLEAGRTRNARRPCPPPITSVITASASRSRRSTGATRSRPS
jgi:PadR family transcriptional regulator AphA